MLSRSRVAGNHIVPTATATASDTSATPTVAGFPDVGFGDLRVLNQETQQQLQILLNNMVQNNTAAQSDGFY